MFTLCYQLFSLFLHSHMIERVTANCDKSYCNVNYIDGFTECFMGIVLNGLIIKIMK